MNPSSIRQPLLIAGAILFLIGLMVGGLVPYFTNTRMGLSAHLAACQNALVLFAFGYMTQYMALSQKLEKWFYYSSVYGMYAVWAALALAAILGTSSATPIAGKGFSGSMLAETAVNIPLYSGSAATFLAAVLLIKGLIQYRS